MLNPRVGPVSYTEALCLNFVAPSVDAWNCFASVGTDCPAGRATILIERNRATGICYSRKTGGRATRVIPKRLSWRDTDGYPVATGWA